MAELPYLNCNPKGLILKYFQDQTFLYVCKRDNLIEIIFINFKSKTRKLVSRALFHGCECLVEILYDVIHIFDTHG